MTTKKELAVAMAAMNIALPDNWSKLSTDRATAFVTNELAAHAILSELDALSEADKAEAKGFISRAKDKVKSALGLDKAARKNAEMKVFSDPTYRRTTRKMRRFMAERRVMREAVNPEVPTRQMLRRQKIEMVKQPLDMSQQAWHQLKGFGKVQPFGSSSRQTRNKHEKARREQAIRNAAMGV